MGRSTVIRFGMGLLALLVASCGDDRAPDVTRDACAEMACSGHGVCVHKGEVAFCDCHDGFRAGGDDFLECVESAPACADVDCGGHGRCVVSFSVPFCECDDGYHMAGPELLDCQPDDMDPCAGILCSGHGVCITRDGVPFCECNDGYRAGGPHYLECIPVIDPCAGVDCSGHGYCVTAAGVAFCDCDDGYAAAGDDLLACVAASPCTGVDCSGHGTCLVVGESAVCDCDAGYVAEGLLCVLDSVWPASPWEYTGDTTVYVDSMSLPSMSGDECCHDLNDDGIIDNAYADLLNAVQPLMGIDVNDILAQEIQSGGLVLLFDHRAFDAAASSQSLSVAMLEGAFAPGTDFALAAAGSGQFELRTTTFLDDSGRPRSVLEATCVDAALDAGPGEARVYLPGLKSDMGLEGMPLREARLTAALDVAGDTPVSLGYTAAELSGILVLEDLRMELNRLLQERCSCLGTGEEVFGPDWETQCVSNAGELCIEEDEQSCVSLAGPYCAFLGNLFESAADVDSDGDGTVDALSLGVRLTAVPAAIVGIFDPCADKPLCGGEHETAQCADDVLHECVFDDEGCLVQRETGCSLFDSVCMDNGVTAACVCEDEPECAGREPGWLACDDNVASFCLPSEINACLVLVTEPCGDLFCLEDLGGCGCPEVPECLEHDNETICVDNTLRVCATNQAGCHVPEDTVCDPWFCDAQYGGCAPAGSCVVPYPMPGAEFVLSGDDFGADFADLVSTEDPSCTAGAPAAAGPEVAIEVPLIEGQRLFVRESGGLPANLAVTESRCYSEPICASAGLDTAGALRFDALTDQTVVLVVYAREAGPGVAQDYAIEILVDPVCGNGFVDANEQCDDGNLTDADGCTACAADPGTYCDLSTAPTPCYPAPIMLLDTSSSYADTGGLIPAGESHYYRIILVEDGLLDLTVTPAAIGDPAVEIFDPVDHTVYAASAAAGAEQISGLSLMSGEYILRVYASPVDDIDSYDIELSLSAP